MSTKNYIDKRELSHDEWLAGRQHYLGASETAAVLGLDKYKTPFQVWAEKTGRAEKVDNPHLAARAEAGRRAEDFIAQWIGDKYDLKVRRDNKIRLHSNMEFWGANLDRLIVGKEVGPIPLEIKTGTFESIKTWSIHGDEINPLFMHHWVQVQSQLAITGYNLGFIGAMPADSYRGFGEPVLIEITPDVEFIAGMEEKIRRFWEDHILKDVPPEITTLGDMSIMFPKSTPGKTIDLLDDQYQLLQELKQIQDNLKESEERKEQIKTALALLMGDAEEAVYNGATLITYKSGKDKQQFNSDKFMNNYPDLAENCSVKIIDEDEAKAKFTEQYLECCDTFPGSRRFSPKYNKL